MAGLCALGGVIGFARTKSVPSLVAGLGVGSLYGLAGYQIQSGGDNGYEVAAAASVLLLGASAPRVKKGPVPKALTATSLLAGAYYTKKVIDFRAP